REAEEEAALKAEEDVGLKAEPEAALQAGFKELKEKKKAAEEEKKATSIALANKEQDVIIGAPYAHYYPHQYSYSEILLNLFCGIGNLVCGVLTRIKNIFCCIIFGCDFDKLIKKNTVNFNVKELKKIAVIYNLPAKDKDKSIHKKLDPPWCTVMDNMKRLYSSTEGRKISYLSFVSKIIGCKADVDNIINGKEVLCDALISTDNHDTNKIFNNKARWKTTTMNLLAAETSIIFLNCRQGLLNDHFIDGEFLSIRDLIIALLRQNSNTKIIVTEDEGSKLLKPGLLYNITTYQSDVEECQVLSQLERTDGFLTVYRIFTGTQRAKLEEAFQYTRA
ncbi:MAG: hypothetical protein KAG53_01640, partial [Endozoicomonadaceae bacterium]|nr:hypothetical protein [Endozoicomonadaceae bacterium]